VITPSGWIAKIVCARVVVIAVDIAVLAACRVVTPIVGALIVIVAVHSLDDATVALPLCIDSAVVCEACIDLGTDRTDALRIAAAETHAVGATFVLRKVSACVGYDLLDDCRECSKARDFDQSLHTSDGGCNGLKLTLDISSANTDGQRCESRECLTCTNLFD